jgi:uncharacterized protein YndB with AHSA1/START domain
MSEFRIVTDYPHLPHKVWRALTDPKLIPLWTTTGKGGRPVGFATEIGTKFQFVAKAMPGWDGVVECQVIECVEGSRLRYTWLGDEGDDLTTVSYQLEPNGSGTRFTWEHTGFTGVGGFVVCSVLKSVRRKMLEVGLRRLLGELDDEGKLRPGR